MESYERNSSNDCLGDTEGKACRTRRLVVRTARITRGRDEQLESLGMPRL